MNNKLLTTYLKLALFLLCGLFLTTGCSAKITRYGYTSRDVTNVERPSSCFVPIRKNFVYDKKDVEVLGEIKSGDTGFSLECSKGHVLNIFQQEACALKADLINITYERDTDLWSSCYRAKAEFLRFKDREMIKNL